MGKDVIIIGGGANAVSAYTRVPAGPGISSVTFVAPHPIGLGGAFGTTDPELLCNTSVDVTSLDPEGTSGLLTYLTARGWPTGRDDFVPRYLVGQYCRERYRQARAAAHERGTTTHHLTARARTVRRDGGRYTVRLDDGREVTGSDVLVCLGLDRPRLPDQLRPHRAHPELLTSPYPIRRLRELPADATVLLYGTKLSAIDAALVLLTGDSGRRVVMTSPSGALPAVRTRLCRPDKALLETDRWLALDPRSPHLDTQITRILVSALSRHAPRRGLGRQTSTASTPAARLAEELHLATTGAAAWQDVIAETIDTINEWAAPWSPQTRADVLGRFREPITRYISAIPAVNARRLAAHQATGALHIADAMPQQVRPRPDGGWLVRWPGGREEHVDRVVCATGYHAPRLTWGADGTLHLDGSGGTDAHITEDLRVTPDPSVPGERVWAIGAAAHRRTPIVNYLRTAAFHAREVGAQLVRP
ncbi:FAD/NAD(P)-binding protein [Streptomyces sp. NPDC000229]|uniref:FAD/NAD(P)-binding protein n=1 Tax=Streptomyces sp. NPDC000229 TaxID=3154247 RepID=UPI00331B7583